ncbi:MAG: GMC family oxidoreductase [Longimicrobiales bacterium]
MIQVRRSRTDFDVVIVGSGAGGGMAAYTLTKAGAKVAVVEAGPMWNSATDSDMLKWPYHSPRRGGSTPTKPFGEFDGCIGGWRIDGEPYTVAPGNEFQWWRARMLGGRTNHWGRISLRFGPYDFRRKSMDGLGDNWPITYDDMKPYYDAVDRLVGVYGTNEGLPNEPDGIFQPPPAPRCTELWVKETADKLGITCVPGRLSILTKPLNGRPACHYCGQCNRGCRTHSNFSSPGVLLAPAMATGNLTIIPNSMVREVSMNAQGLATGVHFVNRDTGVDEHIQAKVVVLAASACESARLLLNSKSPQFTEGLANSSGKVGRYLMDSTGGGVSGYFEKMRDMPAHNHDGTGGMHLYMPWWLEGKKLDFPRGYHIEFGGGRGMPGYGAMGGIHNLPPGGGYGAQLKKDYRSWYGVNIGFDGRGEMIPNEDTYCEIDPTVVDRYGIPVMRFHWKFQEYELLQGKHMQETFRGIIEAMGGVVRSAMPTAANQYGLARGGEIIHEVGTTRMGKDPKTSVVNEWCQAHDVKNLFVADGGPFVSSPDKNATWTILALSMRTSTKIAEMRKAGEI